MKTHELVIHIGTLKTGTTTLQNFLYENRDNLIKEGWYYPISKEYGEAYIVNGRILLNPFLDNDNATVDRNLAHIVKLLDKYNVILSCENFWLLSLSDMKNLFLKVKKFYSNIKIVVYIRRQDMYIESLYCEWVKLFVHTEKRELLSFVDYVEKKEIANYLEKLMTLKDIFSDNLIVRRFERESLKKQDIVFDFLSILGINIKTEDIKLVEDKNQAIGYRLLELRRLFNDIINSEEFPLNRNLNFAIGETIIKINEKNKKRGIENCNKIMPPELRKEILQKYEEENKQIAKDFFSEDKLFKNMNVEIPYKQAVVSPIEKYIMEVFTTILYKHEINLSFLNSMQNKKRKLAYFGAGECCKNFLKTRTYIPEVIIDNYKNNTFIENIPVIDAKSIKNWKDYLIIITCRFAIDEVELQLKQKELIEGRDYIKCDNIFLTKEPVVGKVNWF